MINQINLHTPYPCQLASNDIEHLKNWTNVSSEEELLKHLKLIFSHESTQKVINALISQSKEAA